MEQNGSWKGNLHLITEKERKLPLDYILVDICMYYTEKDVPQVIIMT